MMFLYRESLEIERLNQILMIKILNNFPIDAVEKN